jgi:hypothetical protein
VIKAVLPAAGLAIAVASAGLAPIDAPSRDAVFAIPQGTWARRMAGAQVEILPSEIRLTLGVRDALVLENHDDVPQIFGPTLLMPGQTFRLPFAVASRYQFVCTAHLSGQMTILVEPFPDTPWARVAWRARELWDRSARGVRT